MMEVKSRDSCFGTSRQTTRGRRHNTPETELALRGWPRWVALNLTVLAPALSVLSIRRRHSVVTVPLPPQAYGRGAGKTRAPLPSRLLPSGLWEYGSSARMALYLFLFFFLPLSCLAFSSTPHPHRIGRRRDMRTRPLWGCLGRRSFTPAQWRPGSRPRGSFLRTGGHCRGASRGPNIWLRISASLPGSLEERVTTAIPIWHAAVALFCSIHLHLISHDRAVVSAFWDTSHVIGPLPHGHRSASPIFQILRGGCYLLSGSPASQSRHLLTPFIKPP
jgi:hypothetical protein